MIEALYVALMAIVAGGIGTIALLFYQGKRKPGGNPQYVALGSSFAAGIGLGKRTPGSPLICMRSVNSYPQQLARIRGLSLVDMTCSGATSKHVLHGGQVFLGSQLDALSKDTELVTMTIGGNDIRYVGDLSFMSGSKASTISGWAMRRLWKGPLSPEQRNYAKLREDILMILKEARRRSPRARIVVVTYPMILPPEGTCARLSISEEEASAMRVVGERLAEVTRAAANEGGAILVDMQRLGITHHACSDCPWVNGWEGGEGAPYHPTLEGAQATAQAIAQALDAPFQMRT